MFNISILLLKLKEYNKLLQVHIHKINTIYWSKMDKYSELELIKDQVKYNKHIIFKELKMFNFIKLIKILQLLNSYQ